MRNAAGSRHSLRSTRKLTILAQDPACRVRGRMLRAKVDVPAEDLMPGPVGYRVAVIDYDVTADVLYSPADLGNGFAAEPVDPFAEADDAALLADPRFHAQNAYAIVMRTLARFEFALGRRIGWGCDGHQLHVSPHAFAEANAFYSREDRSLFFGYFPGAPHADGTVPMIFTSLSHDVIAHETTHALLDGLRARYLEPSSPDQAAFHEGFADIVSLLSQFALPEVIAVLLDREDPDSPTVDPARLTEEALMANSIFGLAEEMGWQLSEVRGAALRRSVQLAPNPRLYDSPAFREEHRRGELLVAAMLRTFLEIWVKRLALIGSLDASGRKSRELVVDEGAKAANHLLTMAIRAIDYCPPVDLTFPDFLSAMLTVDREVVPDDRHGYRASLLRNFEAYGIKRSPSAGRDGSWKRCNMDLVYSRTHFDSLLRSQEEVFRFLWENRADLAIGDDSYIEVLSVVPSTRIAPDGFMLRESIAEYIQILTLTAGELRTDYQLDLPPDMPAHLRVRLFGGGALVFDEYGQLKYQIANHLLRTKADIRRQQYRLQHLWGSGFFDTQQNTSARFSAMHVARGRAGEVA